MLSLNDLNKAHEEFYYLQDFTLNSLYYDTDENITETTDNFVFRDVKTDEVIVAVNTHFYTFDIFIDNAIVDSFLFSEMIERYVWDRQDFAERVKCDDNDIINSFTRNEQYTEIQVVFTANAVLAEGEKQVKLTINKRGITHRLGVRFLSSFLM